MYRIVKVKGKDIVKRLIVILLVMGQGLLAMAQDDTLAMVVDTAIMAPMQVKPLGTKTYDDLNRVHSSLDLQDPENVNTTIEYDPVNNCYVVRTRMGDVEIATPYMMTPEEYQAYSERQQMGQYWQEKISTVEQCPAFLHPESPWGAQSSCRG